MTKAGWYRVARTINNSNGIGKTGILIVEREYNTQFSEAYTFSIAVTYSDPPVITQLSGIYMGGQGHKLSKIRVLYKIDNIAYIDVYYTGETNAIGLTAIGGLVSYDTITESTISSGYSSLEFDTVKGFKTTNMNN